MINLRMRAFDIIFVKKRVCFVSKLNENDLYLLPKIETSREILFKKIEELTGVEAVNSCKISEEEFKTTRHEKSWIDENLYREMIYENCEEHQGTIAFLTSIHYKLLQSKAETNNLFEWCLQYLGKSFDLKEDLEEDYGEDSCIFELTRGYDCLYFYGFTKAEIEDYVEYIIEEYCLKEMVVFPIKYVSDGKEYDSMYRYLEDVHYTEFYIANGIITEINLTELQNCPYLEVLNLSHHNLSKVELPSLQTFKYLKEVNISSNNLTEIDLTFLQDCSNLQILNLARNNLTKIDLTPLWNCKKLTDIDLSGNKLSEIGLEPLKECRNLRNLLLFENKLSKINFKPLEQFNQLEQIDLQENNLQIINFKPLRSCWKLKWIILAHNNILKVDLTPLKALGLLEEIDFSSNPISEIDLSPLEDEDLIVSHFMGRITRQ